MEIREPGDRDAGDLPDLRSVYFVASEGRREDATVHQQLGRFGSKLGNLASNSGCTSVGLVEPVEIK